MSVYLAVDTGGTFTDLAFFDTETRKVRYTKSLTTHHNPIEGILDCVSKVGMNLGGATLFKHGTTLVINTLIERDGPKVALISTKGFRDAVELGRGNRTETFNLFYRRNPPLVPRELRFEIAERIDGRGKILSEPSRAEVEAIATRIRELGVSSVGICFLNSYLEPVNESLVAGWLREMLPDCFVTASSELTREWYEHERASTVAANAYVGPKIGGYVSALAKSMKERGFGGSTWLMGSNGGVLSVGHAAAAPVILVESGPVGGCIGAAAYGEALGISDLIAFDMGGTTAKCALIRQGRFNITSLYYVGDHGKGIPIRTPVIDIVEVGTGGGSIAYLDPQNRLKVGPKSAGAMPGPVCYGRGGTEPTVTDANLVLGRLNADTFQGGEMNLDLAGAKVAFEKRLGERLGYTGETGVTRLASGVLKIATVQMSEAIKRVSVQCGQDARDFALFAFGGGGPLHSVELARELSIPLVIIPPEAGNFSAVGMLLSDIKRDDSRTFPKRLQGVSLESIETVFAEMEEGLRQTIVADFGTADVRFERFSEIRFVGQYHTVRVAIGDRALSELSSAFLRAYKETYGHIIERAEAEIVSLHAVAYAATPKPQIGDFGVAFKSERDVPVRSRKVFFASSDRHLDASVYSRDQLAPGFFASGPAIIEEYGSTTILGPDDKFEVGKLGEIRISVNYRKSGGAA